MKYSTWCIPYPTIFRGKADAPGLDAFSVVDDDDIVECHVSIFRQATSTPSALDEYMEVKRREFIGSSNDEVGQRDAAMLRLDVARLGDRIEHQLADAGRSSVCYLVMGRVQSGKTGHQLGMLSWAADKCDVAVIFTGVTEALNGQTSYRISNDLGALPSSPVATVPVPTRIGAQRDPSFIEGVLKRAEQRRDYRAGDAMWPERLPILVSMKTKPRVDAIKWLFQEVAERLGEGVTALIIDDEADQASPNAAARRGEEAATYAELKALRDAATHHVWLSYTATPQAIFLTEEDGALRPDYCAVSRPGTDYFGLRSLMSATQNLARVDVSDWNPRATSTATVPRSLKEALSDTLVAAWLRLRTPDAFYRRGPEPATEGMRSVQMLIHTSAQVRDHARDFSLVQSGLEQLRGEIERAIRDERPEAAPVELVTAWDRCARRLREQTGGAYALPELSLESLFQIGGLFSRIETRVVNSDPARPTAPAGSLPTSRASWEAHPIWVIIGGDILGRGLTIPQLVTTYFTRIAQIANEDTVAQQMRFCGYRSTYSHVVTVHAPSAIFDSFDYLSQVERALVSAAEEWEERDKDLQVEQPALWYVSRPTNRMRPTRLAVRDRALTDQDKNQQVLAFRQLVQPQAFALNARTLLDWLNGMDTRSVLDEWLLAESGADEVKRLIQSFAVVGSDGAERDIAVELMNGRLGDLGLANLPFAVFVRGLEAVRSAAARTPPDPAPLPVRRLLHPAPSGARAIWESGWSDHGAIRSTSWYDTARLGVPHIGDGQRRPIRELGYDAVSVVIEPLAVYSTDGGAREGAGLAVSMLSPDGFHVRAIGVATN